MAKAQNVKYNKEILEMVKNLTPINNSVVIEKDVSTSKSIVINATNPTTTIAYKFLAPVDSFAFDGEEIAFYDFSEFFQLFSYFKNPELQQNTNQLLISSGKSKINYLLSDTEVIKKGPKKVAFSNPDVSFQITSEDVTELEKIINLINAENVNISVKGNKATFKLYNSAHENSFQKEFKIENASQSTIDLNFSSEVFALLPKESYKLEIKKEGIMKISLEGKSDISLELYVAEVEEE